MKKNMLFVMSTVLLMMAGMVMTACSDDEVNDIVYKKESPRRPGAFPLPDRRGC